jgi:hypothetical protein
MPRRTALETRALKDKLGTLRFQIAQIENNGGGNIPMVLDGRGNLVLRKDFADRLAELKHEEESTMLIRLTPTHNER